MAQEYVRRPAVGRVLAKVIEQDRGYGTVCWIFTGARDKLGYGRVNCRNGTGSGVPKLVHRVVYEAFRGPIPDGLGLDHLCRQPSCCNPDHLEAVTQTENIRRGRAVGLSHAKLVCKNGHEMTPENTRLGQRNGHEIRRCRACARMYDKR